MRRLSPPDFPHVMPYQDLPRLEIKAYEALLELAEEVNKMAEYDMDSPVSLENSLAEALAMILKRAGLGNYAAIVELDREDRIE